MAKDISAAQLEFPHDFISHEAYALALSLTKESLLAMGRTVKGSFANYGFVLNDLRKEGDFVVMTGHFQGTHWNILICQRRA